MKIKNSTVSLFITMLVIVLGVLVDDTNIEKVTYYYNYIAVEKDSFNALSIENQIEENIDKNKEIYEFYSYTFGISLDDLKKEIKLKNKTSFNELNLNNNDKNYDRLDDALLNFILDLQDEKEELFNRTYEYKKTSKEYIYGLIDYYCTIFTNVDVQTAKSIVFLESGNLSAEHMMKKNNIFGGMSNRVLYKYPTIEYGVYKYVRLLSKSYYGIGLNTVETIGKKYNPTVIRGKEVADPSWVAQVNSILKRFDKEINIKTIEELNKLK